MRGKKTPQGFIMRGNHHARLSWVLLGVYYEGRKTLWGMREILWGDIFKHCTTTPMWSARYSFVLIRPRARSWQKSSLYYEGIMREGLVWEGRSFCNLRWILDLTRDRANIKSMWQPVLKNVCITRILLWWAKTVLWGRREILRGIVFPNSVHICWHVRVFFHYEGPARNHPGLC